MYHGTFFLPPSKKNFENVKIFKISKNFFQENYKIEFKFRKNLTVAATVANNLSLTQEKQDVNYDMFKFLLHPAKPINQTGRNNDAIERKTYRLQLLPGLYHAFFDKSFAQGVVGFNENA